VLACVATLILMTAVVAAVGLPVGCGGAAGAAGCGGLSDRDVVPMSCSRIRVTQGFGDTPWEHPHTGVDIVCPPGTPVVAVVAGTFHRRSDLTSACLYFPWLRGGYGKYATVLSASGVEFVYAHLASYEAADGSEVEPGTTLGFEGTTGCSTGFHLHFEVRAGGRAVNPCPYLPTWYPSAHPDAARCWAPAPP